jgi:hypothetical protein
VSDYVKHFSVLVDQLTAYEAEYNPLYYATRFVDGLRDDIKSIVMIQHPSSLDYACALALGQEEATDSHRKKHYRHSELLFNRSVQKPAFPLPPPPKPGSVPTEGHRNTEGTQPNAIDDKLRDLKEYRRARGLCDRCADKWSYGHKCASTIQLHALQEFWDFFQMISRSLACVLLLTHLNVLLNCACFCPRQL